MNTKLQTFPYTYIDKANKPNLIPQRDLDDTEFVKQKASSSLAMAYILPLLLGDILDVDDVYYTLLGACTNSSFCF